MAARSSAKDNITLIRRGWIAAILLWPVGAIIGVVLLARGENKQGGWILGVSLAVIIVVIVSFILGSWESSSVSTTG
jgi:hypothetical protein